MTKKSVWTKEQKLLGDKKNDYSDPSSHCFRLIRGQEV